jgi:hypothetical protein
VADGTSRFDPLSTVTLFVIDVDGTTLALAIDRIEAGTRL